ncbi:MAG: hypothetical protein R3F65_29185 [bacterium]
MPWHTRRVQRLVKITLAIQAVGLIVLASIWIVRRADDDPAAPFRALQRVIIEHGPVVAIDALGPSIMRAASLACRRDACIAARFDGNRGRWVVVSAAKGEDPCEDYQHPPCRQSYVRQALGRVLNRAASCEVVGVLNRGADKRIRVSCGGVQDFVTVTRDVTGAWRLDGDEVWPGFLPRLYDGQKP